MISTPSPDRSPPSVLVVGAGPVGHALTEVLTAQGFPLIHWSRGHGPLWAQDAQPAPADIVILAVRDDAIAQAARYIVEHHGAGPHSVLLHCAGALSPLDVLAAEATHVAGRGLFHPLRSFVAGSTSPSLQGTVIAIAGDEKGSAAAQHLCRAVGGLPLLLRPEQQALYHAAAVLSAGHVAALLDVAVHILIRVGLDRTSAEQSLLALTRSVLDNASQVGLTSALSGPVARGDLQTVAQHLHSLHRLSCEAEDVYRVLAHNAVDMAYRRGLVPAQQLDALAALLAQPARS